MAHRQQAVGPLTEHQESWRADYEHLRATIDAAVWSQVIQVCHVGSTAVSGLPAKPVVDVDLTVPDADDEPAYLPALEAAGFRLIFRDTMAGDPHRQLAHAAPNANVWSPGALEPRRHLLFVQWLRGHPTDRAEYAEAKRRAWGRTGPTRYNDLKAAVVYDIYERAFAADPLHRHEHRPRPGSADPR